MSPRTDGWLTYNDLIEVGRKEGWAMGRNPLRRLQYLVTARLIRPKKTGGGRGKPVYAIFPPGTLDRLREIDRLYRGGVLLNAMNEHFEVNDD